MSKKRPSKSSTSRGRRKKKSNQWSGLIIPIAVGLIIVVVIVGAIVSVENRRRVSASALGGDAGAVATMQALPSQSLPYPGVPRVSVEETVEKLEQGTGVLVDVRSKSSYDSSHATGAISIPESEITVRLEELPRDQDVILYCT